MPELRKDPIVDRWVIIAKDRANRPQEIATTSQTTSSAPCPFCEGNEAETPGELLAFRSTGSIADGPGWRVRVVPNKFPALKPTGDTQQTSDGFYESHSGIGAHEVIIETPRHRISASELSEDNLREVLRAYRERLIERRKDRRLAYGVVFKNVGGAAGASIEHTHSQLIATPIVPPAVCAELQASLARFRERGRCVYCQLIDQERAAGRIVHDESSFIAFCPFASRSPYETWILPTAHASRYEAISDGDVTALAQTLKRVIGKIEQALGHPAYNYVLHTSPFHTPELDHYHWRIEIIPRVTELAGFEWGTGYYINPVPPEEAASMLREVEAEVAETQSLPARETG